MEERIMAKPFKFKDEGVSGKIPDKIKDVKPKKIKKGSLKDMPATPGVFSPNNLRINIVFYKEKKPDKYLDDLGAEVEIRVGYKQSDLDHAAEQGEELQLAYWKGKKWNPLEFVQEDPTFPGYVGDAVVKISKWGDPPIALGP
jgi:hypothetical protein